MPENQISKPEAQEFPYPLSVETRNKLDQAKREILDEIVSLYAQYNIPVTITENYSLSLKKKVSEDGFREFFVLGIYDYNATTRTYLFDLSDKKLVCRYLGINNEDNAIFELNNPTRFEENVAFIYKTYTESLEFKRNQTALKQGLDIKEVETYSSGH